MLESGKPKLRQDMEKDTKCKESFHRHAGMFNKQLATRDISQVLILGPILFKKCINDLGSGMNVLLGSLQVIVKRLQLIF